ncbi:MoaD/ThiS family protein [Marinobacterium marinum]|uniref:MoaD/ThiS family protein n=1 Tax=Marinobacterium marinum TaxID=2756129 RepID=A0A7W1WY16_9GAMM|nr:MoaD/ThiS family protein [Marinobacterium marinum]MBA4502306.1 MoaD/ThiS family protein [Marinobacterium marinum]
MSIKVMIPSVLRPFTNGAKEVSAEGKTIMEVIASLEMNYNGISTRLLSGNRLHRYINIFLNDEDIRFAQGLDTPVTGGDRLTVLPAVAGGAFVPSAMMHVSGWTQCWIR